MTLVIFKKKKFCLKALQSNLSHLHCIRWWHKPGRMKATLSVWADTERGVFYDLSELNLYTHAPCNDSCEQKFRKCPFFPCSIY